MAAHDTWFYSSHWLMHKPRLCQLFHRTHHKFHNPTPFCSHYIDASEAVVQAIFLLLFLIVIPMQP